MAWDDRQYLKFADERTRPARELLARAAMLLEAPPQAYVDLGCGPGNSTELLAARWPQARGTGVDNSPEMLQRARTDFPGLEWIESDIVGWRPAAPVDLLFANAALQWLPDHTALFPALLESVNSGGVFAVQMPRNFGEPSHRLMRETDGPWRQRIQAVQARAAVHTPAFYYDLLAPRVRQLDIWQTIYEHVMPDSEAIVEWVRGTGLRPFLDALREEEVDDFLAAYRAGLDSAYPPRSDGRRLFSFSRIFIVAQR